MTGSKIDAAVAARTAYPSELKHEVSLKDGARARIRPIRPHDRKVPDFVLPHRSERDSQGRLGLDGDRCATS